MKPFFQSFSFLRDKEYFKSTLEKVDIGWLIPRFFVIALIGYVIFAIVSFVNFRITLTSFGYDFSKENVSHDVNIVSKNVLSFIPQDIKIQSNLSGWVTNISDTIEIPYWVLYSGTSFTHIIQDDIVGYEGKTLMLIDTIHDDANIDYTAQPMTLTRDYFATFDGKKVQKQVLSRINNQMQEEFKKKDMIYSGSEGGVVYKDLLNIQELLVQGVYNNRDSFVLTTHIVIVIGGIFLLLLAAIIVSLYTVFVAYVRNLLTRALASITKKGRDYTTSYSHTILAAFPIFILNRFTEIPWYIDIVMIIVLVFVVDYISQKNHNS